MMKRIYTIAFFLLISILLYPNTTKATKTVDVEFKFLSYTGNKLTYDLEFQIVESGLSINTGPTFGHDGTYKTAKENQNRNGIIYSGIFDPKSSILPKASIEPFKPYTVLIRVEPKAPERLSNYETAIDLQNIPLIFTRPLRVTSSRTGEKAIVYKLPEEVMKKIKINFISPFLNRQDNPAYNPDDPNSRRYTYKRAWMPYQYNTRLSIIRKTTGMDSTAQIESTIDAYSGMEIVLPYGIYDFIIEETKYLQGKHLRNIVIKKDREITIYLRRAIEQRNINEKITEYSSTCQNMLSQYPNIYDNTFNIKSLPREAQECYYATFPDSIHNIPKELMKTIPIFPYTRDKKTNQKIPINGIKIYATDKKTKETITFDLDNIVKDQTTGKLSNNLINLPPHRTFYISAYKEGYDAGGTIEFHTNKQSNLYFYLRKLEEPTEEFENFPEDKKKSIWFDVRDSITKEPINNGKFIITSINYDTTIEHEFTNYQTMLKLPPGTYTIKVQADNYVDAVIREYRIPAKQKWSKNINFTLLPINATRKYTIDIKVCKEIQINNDSLNCIPFNEENIIFMGLDEEEVNFYIKDNSGANIKKTYWSYMDRKLPEHIEGTPIGDDFLKHATAGNIVQTLLGNGIIRLEGELPLGQTFYIKGYLKFKYSNLEFKIKMPTAKIDTRPFNRSSISCSQNNTFCTNVILARDWKEPAKVEIMKAIKGRMYDLKVMIKDAATGSTEVATNSFPVIIKGKAIANSSESDTKISSLLTDKIWLPDGYIFEVGIQIPYEDIYGHTLIEPSIINNILTYPSVRIRAYASLNRSFAENKKIYIKTPFTNPQNNKNEIIIYTAQSSKYIGLATIDIASVYELHKQYDDSYDFDIKIKLSNPEKKYTSYININREHFNRATRLGKIISPKAMLPHSGDYIITATLKIYDQKNKKIVLKKTLEGTLNIPEGRAFRSSLSPYIALDFVPFTANIPNEVEYITNNLGEEQYGLVTELECKNNKTPVVLYAKYKTKNNTVTIPEGIKILIEKPVFQFHITNTSPSTNYTGILTYYEYNKDGFYYFRDGTTFTLKQKTITIDRCVTPDPGYIKGTPPIEQQDYEGKNFKRKIKVILTATEPFKLSRFHIDTSKITNNDLNMFFDYGKIAENCLNGKNCMGTWENSYATIIVNTNNPFEETAPRRTIKLFGKGSATTHTKSFTVTLPAGTHRIEINVPGMSKAVGQLEIFEDDPPEKEYLLQYQLSPLPPSGNIKERFLILKLVSDKKDVGFEGVTPFINIGGVPIQTIRSITQGTKTDWFTYIGGVPIPLRVNPENKFETIPIKIPLGKLAGGTEVTYQAYTSETATVLSRSYLGRAFYNLMNLTDDIFNFDFGKYNPPPDQVTPVINEAKAKELYEAYQAEMLKTGKNLEINIHRPKGGRFTIPDDDEYIIRKIILPVGHGKGQDDDELYDVDITINAMSDRGFHSSYLDFLGIFTVTKAFTQSTKGLNALRKIESKIAEDWYKTRKYHIDILGNEILEALKAANWGKLNNVAQETARLDYAGKYIRYDKTSDKISMTLAGEQILSSSFHYREFSKTGRLIKHTENLMNKIQKEIDTALKLSRIDPKNTVNTTYIANNFSKPIENAAKAFKQEEWYETKAKFLEKKIANVNKALDEVSRSTFGKMISQTNQIATVLTQQPFTKALAHLEKMSKLTILTPVITTILPFMGLPPSGMPLIQLKSTVDGKMVIPENKEFTNTRKELNEYLPGAGAIVGWLKNISIKPTKAEPIKVRLKVQKNKPIIIKAVAQGHNPYEATINPPPPNEDGNIPNITLDITMIRNEGWMFESVENFFNANPLLAEKLEALFLSPEMFYGTSETAGIWESFIESTGNILFDSLCKDLSNFCNSDNEVVAY